MQFQRIFIVFRSLPSSIRLRCYFGGVNEIGVKLFMLGRAQILTEQELDIIVAFINQKFLENNPTYYADIVDFVFLNFVFQIFLFQIQVISIS